MQQTVSAATNQNAGNPDAPSSEAPAVANTFTLEILKIIKEGQQQHGLRHSDYQRYRAYCTRRVRRVRKTLHFLCGNMKRYQKREVKVEEITDSKFLLIPLFLAERAWAYAMQLKQESNTDRRKRFHLANRLRKAIKYSAELEKISSSPKCDARTKLEAQGYNSLMNGLFNFEMQKWNESLNHFTVAKKIYEKLSAALKGDEAQVFYTQKVDEITPNIRYCNYNLGDESAKKDLIDMKLKSATGSELAENIDSLISQTKEKQIKTFSEVTWRDNIVLQIKNEKVRLFLLNVQEFEKQIQSSDDYEVKISIFENIMKESIDAIQIVRDELKTDALFQAIQRGQILQPEDKPSNLLLLFAYLTYTRVNKSIERNMLLIESYQNNLNKQQQQQPSADTTSDPSKAKNVKPQDIVRLYDIVVQNLKDLANLPGLLFDKQYQSDNELLSTYYKAFRAYYIALFYLANKKYKEAVGFCFKVETYVKSVKVGVSKLAKTSDLVAERKEMENQLDWLISELNNSKYKIQSSALLESTSDQGEEKAGEPGKEKLDKIPLTDRLDVYYDDPSLLTKTPNVAKIPTDFEPVPCKPIFFDLALNHVELPSFADERQQQQQQQQGVKGFIKGIFGF